MSTKVEELNETRLNDGSTQENQATPIVHKSPEGVPYVPGVRTVEQNASSPKLVYGPKGDRGAKGEPGEKGNLGEVGPQGQRGEKGEQGVPGVSNIPGQRGEKGEQGEPGEKGESGEKGEPGDKGEKGDQGEKGETGLSIKGEQGDPGKDSDITAAVAAVTAAVETKLASFVDGLEDLIVAILKRTNVLDADGNAVPGPQGQPGAQGKPGNIAAALANCEQYVEKEIAKFRVELGLK